MTGRRALGVLALLAPALAWGQEPAVKESVKVSLVQIEVTVWPREEGSDACLGLGKDDFELEVSGKPRPIYSVDAVGLEEEVYAVPGQQEDAPGPGGMSVVLLFDLYHLDLFFKGYSACPRGLPLAFREARRYLEEEFRDGDRLLLVTLGGWPVVHEGWIRTREDGLRALQRLEKNRHALTGVGRGHLHHGQWVAGLESLFLAMGRYPGRKDVIWLLEDFAHDDVAMRIFEIAGRAQANGVVVSAVDLLHTCRGIQGPGCNSPSGGLACTPFKVPVALSLSADTGGSLYRNESIARAVAALREGRKCRYLVSFTGASTQKKHPQKITLRLRGNRRDVSLAAPSAYASPARTPSAKAREEALFLLPRFGRGLAAEAAIWPYRAAAKKAKKEKKQKWDVLALARLERTDDEDWPGELTEVTVHVLLHTDSKIHGSYKKTIVGEELAALRAPGATRLLMFPLPDVPAGEVTLDLTVTSNVAGVAANVRKHQAVPSLPRPGEAGPWFLSDHLVRLGDRAVMAPSLDGYVTRGEPAWMLGYGCPPKGEAPASYEARLVSSSGTTSVPVRLGWIPGLQHERACGWLFGSIASDLAPDLWRFEPPAALAPASSGENLEFMVEGGPGETRAVSAEVSPR